jgi:hypothetical protein
VTITWVSVTSMTKSEGLGCFIIALVSFPHTHPLNRLTEGAVPPHCTKADGAQARGA